ncbi:hypothetical protein [Goodfellowiella coeruleoviolacea]|uniref:Uncharacterized protein n=1 Tax=Goodfellowiella coeruleoviolacea TaxID=334858 RepID=A0AAE3GIY9_9PSEU|nr:hypothetical protein [Goodfellowiella coeruleoviolacea]MCP2168174.1 hypothetical protein [Goodfellowiella coeruleoviolacea]
MFTPDPIPRPAGPPASTTPVRDYLATARHGVDQSYVVLPRTLVESMPLPWQQQMTHLLAELHQAYAHLTWPIYRVVPSRYEKLVDLDEDQLAEVGCMVEIDVDGDLVYRERTGARINNAEDTTVLVSCLDPIPQQHATDTQYTPPRGVPVQTPPATPAPGMPVQGMPVPGTPAQGMPVQQAPGYGPQGAQNYQQAYSQGYSAGHGQPPTGQW